MGKHTSNKVTGERGFYALVIPVLLLSACNYRNDKIRVEPFAGESAFSWIQRSVLEPKCITCHNGSSAVSNLNLSSFKEIMTAKVVIPFKPEQSKFYTTIASGQMPKGASKLSEIEIQQVYDWIKEGALEGNAFEPPEPIPQPTLASIQKDFVDRRCVSCHQQAVASNRYIKLTALEEIIEGSTTAGSLRKIIKPGCPKQSFFLSIMKSGEMPPAPLAKASPDWLKAIEEWIVSLNPDAGPLCDDEPE